MYILHVTHPHTHTRSPFPKTPLCWMLSQPLMIAGRRGWGSTGRRCPGRWAQTWRLTHQCSNSAVYRKGFMCTSKCMGSSNFDCVCIYTPPPHPPPIHKTTLPNVVEDVRYMKSSACANMHNWWYCSQMNSTCNLPCILRLYYVCTLFWCIIIIHYQDFMVSRIYSICVAIHTQSSPLL